ncbi:MAG: hypothetical protein V1917_02700 [Candidatus Gottesmanbacteria bacterium]
METVSLSKIDVAKRELDHAIRLFFNYGDIVVIHLVISACQDILEGLNGDYQSIRRELMKRVKKEKRSYVMSKLKHAYNFLKHADKDKKELLDFNPESSEYSIIDAIGLYQAITGEITGLMITFRAWFYLKNPNFLLDSEQKKVLLDTAINVSIDDRAFFLEAAENYEKKRSGV